MPKTREDDIMEDMKLYACPGACSLASHIALEMTRHPFTVELVDLRSGLQRTPEFLAVNPKGKVPAFIVDGRVITENVAIISWLALRFPEAGILPPLSRDEGISALSDLVWFASTLHPAATRSLAPAYFTDAPECEPSVLASGRATLAKVLTLVEERLANQPWWFDSFSAADAYLFVLWSRVVQGAIDAADYPHVSGHAERVRAVPAVQRALEREAM